MSRKTSARRRKPSPASRLRPFWILFVLGIAVVAVAIGFAVTWPGFRPSALAIYGNAIVPRGEIAARAGILWNVNVWLQNPGAIARRVEAIPDVKTASVHRLPPATIRIDVTERAPFAVVRSGADGVVVDRDLRVLAPVRDVPSLVFALPKTLLPAPGTFLTDPAALALRDDYDAMTAAHVVPVELSLDKYGGLIADLRGGIRVLLGDDGDLSKKLPLVDPILTQVIAKQRRVAQIDLREPGTPVVSYR